MYQILGLQNNPTTDGKKYQNTPHNIGGEILEMITNDLKAKIIYSQTYMNNSGDNLSRDLKNNPENLIVVHDDIDLPFGKIKIVFDRGDGGHNGIKDIIQKTKTKKFIRIKIGVCPLDFLGRARKPKRGGLNKYLVHKKLSKKYLKQYPRIAEQVEKIISTITKDGLQKAMNKFN